MEIQSSRGKPEEIILIDFPLKLSHSPVESFLLKFKNSELIKTGN